MMRLFALTALTMAAFAANSVLNRVALAGGHIGAGDFGGIRLVAGAIALAGLCLVLRGRLHFGGPARIVGVASLLVYIYGFSAAYDALDAGLGALILFGVVQITMFAGGLVAGEAMPRRRFAGAGLAMAGLAWLLWPSGGAPVSPVHGLMMAAAGVGWGLYSLSGRRAADALQATAANFVLAAPLGLGLGLALPGAAVPASATGVALAAVSGAVTSGMGYALWYTILPRLDASVAAVAQLCVPMLALIGGMVFLGEALSTTFVLASVLVLGGVAVSVVPGRRR